jgi:internalin A
MAAEPKKAVSVYLSYAQKDKDLKQEFEDYLAILQQIGLISGWVERQVQRGTDWSQVIDPRLLTADLVLVLVSPSLLASGYCSGDEIREAFKRSIKGGARVIPIILHYVNLKGYLFEAIVCIPRNGRPVSSWPDRNEAWRNIDQEIRGVIEY